jgi:hypothetical protein
LGGPIDECKPSVCRFDKNLGALVQLAVVADEISFRVRQMIALSLNSAGKENHPG